MASGSREMVYLIGTAGNPHYGDEVVTASWLRYYAETMPEADVWLDTPRPGQTAVLHGGSHPRLRCVDTLFHAAWNAPSDSAADCIEFGGAVIDEPGRLAREASGFTAAARADLVHVLGGGYINGIWPRHLTLLGAASRIADRSGARTAITGADLTPVAADAKDALGQVLSTFDVVDFRDSASREVVGEAVTHATQTGDDALLDLLRQPVDSRTRAVSVVEIQSDLLDVPLDDLASAAVRLLQSWGVDQEPVLVLESLPPGDLAVAELLRPHLPQMQLRPFEPLWNEGFPAAPAQRWITTRFHSHLMAAAAGAWGVALAGGPVVTSQNQSLLDMGSGWTLLDNLSGTVPAGQPIREPFGGRLPEFMAAKRAVADSVTEGLR